jgi:hypothetical protein
MLKKTITYTDYNNNVRTEDFYFNLTKAELTEMEMSIEGGLTNVLEKMIAEQNVGKLMEAFKNLIIKSYGEKSLDGRRFMKSDQITQSFTQTEAYSELFMELATNAEMAAAFVNGIVPSVSK